MIFVSVGQQRPFERLRIQIENIKETIPQQQIIFKQNVEKSEYQKLVTECDIFIAHAGVGSFLDALQFNKKTILVKRIKGLDPCNTDHQTGLIEFINQQNFTNIKCCCDIEELKSLIILSLQETTEHNHFQNKTPFPYEEIRKEIASIN